MRNKSNFSELFYNAIDKYRNRIIFNVNDLVEEICRGFEWIEEPSEEEKDRFIIKSRVESLMSQNDCYSYKKNHFIDVTRATSDNLGDICNVEESFKQDIKARKNTLKRLKAQEKQIRGQMTLQEDGTLSEFMPIEDRLKEAQ